MRKRLLSLLAVALFALGAGSSVDVPAVLANGSPPGTTSFDIEQSVIAGPLTGEILFTFRMSTVAVPDDEARPDGQRGNYKWFFGDRGAYDSAYFMLLHEDPGAHPFLEGIRISVQNLGGSALRINDRNGIEANLREPYTYEGTFPAPLIRFDFPGAVFHLNHHRAGFVSAGGCRNCNRIAVFNPEVADIADNPKVHWYYQGSGIVIGVHDTLGPIARIIISGVLQSAPGLPLPYAMYFYREARF